jgi:hypothetical protein
MNLASTPVYQTCESHDRAWWIIEARRLGTDWPNILKLQHEIIAAWRQRHDPEYGGGS